MTVVAVFLAVLMLILCALGMALPCVFVGLHMRERRRLDEAARYWLPVTRYRRLWNKRARCLRLAWAQTEKVLRCRDAAVNIKEDGDERMEVILHAEADEARRLAKMYESDAEGWSKAIRLYEARKLVG